MRILILYSSHDGQTQKIMTKIAEQINKEFICELKNLHEHQQIDLQPYQSVIIGASIRYGHFNKNLCKFIQKHHQQLNQIPTAFCSVNLIARKKEKRSVETNIYTRKFLKKSTWQPNMSEVIAGALRYPSYKWYDRQLIKLIMRISGGETDTSKQIEYTDWQQVNDFTERYIQYLKNKSKK